MLPNIRKSLFFFEAYTLSPAITDCMNFEVASSETKGPKRPLFSSSVLPVVQYTTHNEKSCSVAYQYILHVEQGSLLKTEVVMINS